MLGHLATAAALAAAVAAQQPSGLGEGPQDYQQWKDHAASASSQQFSQVNGWISPEYTWLYEFPLPIPEVAVPLVTQTINGTNVEFYNGTIDKFQKQIYPNLGPANLVGYNGSSPGPSFHIQTNTQSVHRWTNNGDTGASVHVHGSNTRSSWDGWASDEVMPGQYKDYYYPNDMNARSLWYHDHAETHTSEDAYFGQAGSFILTDPTEDALGLPTGDYDIPMVIIDKIYGADGDLVSPEGETMNFFGDVMHVNGQPWPYLNVEPRKYRFRLLNCCLSRPLQITLGQDATGNTETFQVIASDAGLFNGPVPTTSMYISMGERYDIIIDFANFTNSNLTMGNILNWGDVPQYAQTQNIMRFVVGGTVTDSSSNSLPATLNQVAFPPARSTVDHVFDFDHNGQNWTINGADFSETEARVLARPPQGSTETWELRYASGPGFHPVHIHLISFQVISRTGGRGLLEPYETAGMKDVVLVAPGEVVTVTATYGPWNGLYMFHCHNLIHEDHFMMDVFNSTANPLLEELGYGDSLTVFDNPKAPEYAPADVDPSKFTLDYITGTLLPTLVNGPAYRNENEIIEALSSYYLTASQGEPATATSATSAMPYATGPPDMAWMQGGEGAAVPSVSATDIGIAPVSYEAGAPFTFTDTIPSQVTAMSVAVVAATNPAEVSTHYFDFAGHSFVMPSGGPSTGFPHGGTPAAASTVEAQAAPAPPLSSAAAPPPPPPPSSSSATSSAPAPAASSSPAPVPQQPSRPVAPSFGPPGGGSFPGGWQQPSAASAAPAAPAAPSAPAPAPAASTAPQGPPAGFTPPSGPLAQQGPPSWSPPAQAAPVQPQPQGPPSQGWSGQGPPSQQPGPPSQSPPSSQGQSWPGGQGVPQSHNAGGPPSSGPGGGGGHKRRAAREFVA